LRFSSTHVSTQIPQTPILSPCNGVCRLGADGYCEGCLRSGDEIARWVVMGDAERRRLLEDVLPRREALRQ
jgi:predicted Fe-S protein YdhL (DUF1289 family)